MRRTTLWLLWLWLGLVACPSEADAQTAADRAAVPPASAELVVLVHDTAGRPLREARVAVWPGGRVALTDAQGRARLAEVPPDSVRLEVVAIGYEPRRLTGVLRAGVSATLPVALTPLAFLLDPLIVERERAVTARLEGSSATRIHVHRDIRVPPTTSCCQGLLRCGGTARRRFFFW